jgi:type III pantothenate kinase
VPDGEARRVLLIGNSRWHWAETDGNGLRVEHGPPDPARIGPHPLIWAAVGPVPPQLDALKDQRIQLADVPLPGCPSWLGVDRAIGAWQAWQASLNLDLDLSRGLMLVDAGTVLSITVLSAQGSFVGGLLLPGYRLQLQAMARGTQDLPELTGWPAAPNQPFPKETAAAMRSGVLHGLAAVVQKAEALCRAQLWICGGDSQPLAEALQTDGSAAHVAEDLQLRGLHALSAGIRPGRDQ